MTTAIIVPVWKRPEITRVCFENLAKTGCEVFVAYSEHWVADLLVEYDFNGFYIQNNPLGEKKNELLKRALEYEWDQVMEMGSDNLINLKKLDQYLSIPPDHYSCSAIYFVKDGEATYYNAPRRIWGAGRIISREAVEKAVPLWEDTGTKFLDGQANAKLERAGYKYSVMEYPMCVDIKSEVNLHGFDRFKGVEVDYGKVAKIFPELALLNN